MRVLQLIDSLRIGGAEVLAANIAAGLAARGHACAVCGLGVSGGLAPMLQQHAIRDYCLAEPFGVSPTIMWRIAGIARRERAGVLVTHHFRQLFHAAASSFFLKTKLIHIEHDYHFYSDDPTSLKRLAFLLKFVDSFVVVSSDIADWFCEQIPAAAEKIITIENGIDTERFRPDPERRTAMRSSCGIDENAFVVGTCARLEPIKNIELLIDGFAGFKSHHDNARLIIIGDGSLMPALQRRVKDLNIKESVLFFGLQSAVEQYLAMFDLYAITSHDEGMPLSVLEAMASGLPVVAANVGSLPRLVSDSTGILLEHSSAHALRTAMASLCRSAPSLTEKGLNARQLVLDRFSLQTMVERYQGVLEKVLTA